MDRYINGADIKSRVGWDLNLWRSAQHYGLWNMGYYCWFYLGVIILNPTMYVTYFLRGTKAIQLHSSQEKQFGVVSKVVKI